MGKKETISLKRSDGCVLLGIAWIEVLMARLDTIH